MKRSVLEPFLKKAKELEKKYKWLQAVEFYKKTSSNALRNNDLEKAAKLQLQMGFCFYRAALQAKSNIEFRKHLRLSISAYKKGSKTFRQTKKEDSAAAIQHAKALVAYTKSWLETNPLKKKMLLAEWWKLENEVLEAYKTTGSQYSLGRVCNDLVEYSIYNRYWLCANHSERERNLKEGIELSEKAIQSLFKSDDTYELARAYCFASWHCSWSEHLWASADKILELNQKCESYTNKALELSHKTGDAWLIGRSYISAWNAAQFCNLNPASAIEYSQKALKYGKITEDNYLMGFANALSSWSATVLVQLIEDPDQQKESLQKAIEMAQEATHNFQIIQHEVGFQASYPYHSISLASLASIEPKLKTKQSLFETATKVMKEGIQRLKDWKQIQGLLFHSLLLNLRLLSETKSETEEKTKLLQEAQFYGKETIAYIKKWVPFDYRWQSTTYFQLALAQTELANIEKRNSSKIKLLNQAVQSMKKCIHLAEKRKKVIQTAWASGFYFGRSYFKLGEILEQIYYLNKDRKNIHGAIEAYKNGIEFFKEEANLPTHIAESHWNLAQLYDRLGKSLEACQHYASAAEKYDLAARKMLQFKKFFEDYSSYMQAWGQIELARYAHSIEDYDKAKEHYENAAKLHQSTDPWSHLAPNYFAWAIIEEAENLSRKENTQQARETFQKALEQFIITEKSIKQKMGEITSPEENKMNQRLLEASDLRRKFCQARIQIEDARLLDREGKYLQSSKRYEEAAQNILSITKKVESEAERKEMEYLAILCQAWDKMAVAEETTSSESYLEAAGFFERAKGYCYTKKASLWTLGNSNFCKGLAAGARYQGNMDLKENAMAKSLLKSAASCYLQAGFKNASEYAKATQRLFDAYVFMNQAENEVFPENRAKQYQMAENLLQIAAGSFVKAKQPEKTAQVQQILKSVREEKALAVSLNEVMHAPTITSSTTSFTAPSPTSEVSVGLEQFQHANVQANLITGLKEVKVGESFCLTVEFVNAGKEPALLTRVEDFVPPDFIVVKKPEIYRLEESCLNMKGKQIAPLKLVEAKLVLQPSKKGVYQLKPTVHYLDELGQNKTLQLKSIEIKVEEVILADRVSTGTKELDSLLLGGIPEEYAVVLTGPPSDERELLIKNFLEAGTKEGQTSFYVTTEAVELENLLEKPSFYLFLCNPKPKVEVPDLPNVIKLRSKTDINNLNMALVRASRNVQQSQTPKRIIIENISDVLLKDGPEITRRWLSELITDLGSKGFTVLAVINPEMHTPDQTGAVLDLFDGEISITQTGDPLECKKSLLIKKLRNQDYIKNPICLTT